MPFHDFGINARFLAFQALNCIVLLVWLGLSVTALLGLRKKNLGEIARVLWTLIILIVPVMGAVAFWLVNPSGDGVEGGVG